MSIKQFQEEHKDFCNKYNEVLDLYYRCGDFVESPERTPKEIDKYCAMLTEYSKKLSLLAVVYKTITDEEMPNRVVLGGFIQYAKTIQS